MIDLTNPAAMISQWTEIQETSLKNTMKSMEMLQKRTEKMMDQLCEQTVWATEKLSHVAMDWGNIYKTGYENLQRVMVPACAMKAEPTREAGPAKTYDE